MIRGYCRTNLDDYRREEWPKEFVAVPRIGDYVQSTSSLNSLKVVTITHKMIKCPDPMNGRTSAYPGIVVELNH